VYRALINFELQRNPPSDDTLYMGMQVHVASKIKECTKQFSANFSEVMKLTMQLTNRK